MNGYSGGMTRSAAQPASDPPRRETTHAPDQRVRLHGVSWDGYEAIDAMRGDSAVPRLTYFRGELELMSPSHHHEGLKTEIGRLVEAYAEERDLDLNGFGSWTLKDRLLELGLEPDECYVLGPLDETRERPDLAIEVKWTSGGLDKLELYRLLGVAEVWVWERGRLHARLLRDGQYVAAERSALLPDLDLARLLDFTGTESQTRAVKAFRKSLREATS